MCQEQRILDLLVEFHKWGDELRNERSAKLSLVEGKGTDDQRNEFCREV